MSSSTDTAKGSKGRSSRRPASPPVGTDVGDAGIDGSAGTTATLHSLAWPDVIKTMNKRLAKQSLSELFPKFAADEASVGRWGLALACGKPISPLQAALSELASGRAESKTASKRLARRIDWELAAEELRRDLADVCSAGKIDLPTAAEAVLWAYALPLLTGSLSEASWKSLVQSLVGLAQQCVSISDAASPSRLIGGSELALVLRWRLGDWIDAALADQAAHSLEQWCDAAEDAISAAMRDGGRYARLVIASVLRHHRLAALAAKRKVKKRRGGTAVDLACWVAAMTRHNGTAVFSDLSRADVADDLARGGLLAALKTLDPKLLGPAIDAVLGVVQTGGRLAWQVSLPESLWHSELAGTAAMLPEWDVRRGRTFIDYAGEDFRIEVELGRGMALGGNWEALIDVDGADQAPSGPWTHVCEYSDDDVHYLEFEQRWTGSVRLQRQVLVLRDDRCVLLADAVLRDADQPSAKIGYIGRVPLAAAITAQAETETTEVWLLDAKAKRRALVLSTQSGEWRSGPSLAKLEIMEDQHLKLQTATRAQCENGGSVFAPLWLDFQQRRFDRPRTWRQLTVADDLRLVDPDEAVANRIQLGSEQWVFYRSLRGERPRTFLGKHLISDFYCARFHPGDGSMEDLLTVGDHDEDIERAAAEAAERQ